MSVFPKDVQEKVDGAQMVFIKAKEFDGAGLVLQITSIDKEPSKDYGAAEDSKIVELGILDEGETFHYEFLSAGGMVRKLNSTSFAFVIGMQNAEINFGDWLHIRREGTGKKTRYFVEKVDKPVVEKPSKRYNSEEADDISANIPF